MLRRLDKLGDLRFVPLQKVKELAETDDFRVDLKDPILRERYTSEYPIRQLASEVLKRFSTHSAGRRSGPPSSH